jgi:tRNA(Ile2) C34 agmatinyltransferase TiaS
LNLELIYVETITESETDEKCVCPNCGETMKRSLDPSIPLYICPKCGCSIEQTEQNLDSQMSCPNCNQLLDGNECPYCGYDLGSDFD